jgi:hypothetical protein
MTQPTRWITPPPATRIMAEDKAITPHSSAADSY